MDTRTKIVSAHEAADLAAAGATVVSGYFDPLLASQARRLKELKRDGVPLLVLIATPKDPILPASARAELVASLGVVDHVAELGNGVQPQFRLEPEHDLNLKELIEHVHARQRASS